LKYAEKRNEFDFEGRERNRVPDVLGEIVSDAGTKVCERGKAVSFAADALEFEHVCV